MVTQTNNFKINGLLDPSGSILDNFNMLATASGCWVTFDALQGLWSVVINKAGPSVKSFNDTNIIGGISVSGTGIANMYNAVSVEFPHVDLNNQTDYIDQKLDPAAWYPNEQENTMTIQFSCLNDPIQAQYIGMTELKQSRIDKIVQFNTDFTSIGLKAGDIIDITADLYGFVNKKFRITQLSENDGDDGTIQLGITAIEYDETIYDPVNLIRTERTVATGITPKSLNTVVTSSDNTAVATQVNNSGANNLYQLNDVWIDAIANKDILQFDGTQWVNAPMSGSSVVYYKVVPTFALVCDGTMQYYNLGLPDWTVPDSGVYKIDYRFLFGTYEPVPADPPPTGIIKAATALIYVNNSVITNIDKKKGMGDGSLFQSPFTDITFKGYFNLTAGDVVKLQAGCANDFNNAIHFVPSGYPSYTVQVGAYLTTASMIEITRIGPSATIPDLT